jgi:hypothetical protein
LRDFRARFLKSRFRRYIRLILAVWGI